MRNTAQLLVFALIAFGATSAQAAGLGKLTVFSALGQPLRADIDLSAIDKTEIDSLSIRLAPVESFRLANIEFNAVLLQLRFEVDKENVSHPVVHVTSAQPVNEPFVDMLVELNWTNGRLVREYTFLLDPPEMKAKVTESIAPATVSSLPAATTRPAAAAPAPSDEASAAPEAQPVAQQPTPQHGRKAAPAAKPAAVAPAPVKAADGQEIKVAQGDTLSKIALTVKPENVTLDQMLVALYQANPDAFSGKNMNRLRTGAIIKVEPDMDFAASDKGEAHRMVVAQTADFNAYREKLAGAVASQSTAPVSAAKGDAASGKISTQVDEGASAKPAGQDKLVLSKPGSAASSAEQKIAKDKALKESEGRAKQLEKNVTQIQKTLEANNKALAEAQKKAEEEKAAAEKAAAEKAAAEKAAADQLAAQKAEQERAAADKAALEQAAAAAAKLEAEKAAAANAAPAPADKPAEKPADQPKAAVPAPGPQTGFLDSLMENPTALYGGLGAIGLLLAYALYAMARKRRFKKFEDSIVTGGDLRANSIFGSTGGQSVDTNSVFNTSFSPSQYQADTNEVDPVAEADVYIAYGREAQAEEILKEALKIQPDRQAIRLKLLEMYSTRGDSASFETVAGEMYSMTNGECEEWPKAVAMGIKLDPNNPLYSGEAQPAANASDASAYVPPLEVAGADGHDTLPPTMPMEDTVSEGTPEDVVALDFDLGLGTAEGAQKVVHEMSQSAPAAAMREEPKMVEPEISLDFDLGEPSASPAMAAASAPAAAPAPLDMSGIDLNLDAGMASDGDDDQSESWQEIATKLDLAKAYIEIGDKEGAQELLEEVVAAGSNEQVVRAKGMLAQI
ncbi:MAG: pilus assembly protein FimV [Burkholderiaceae bacterium]|nr:MAG: pilus assembly protein FimV [Burkholderiaceae bacterium]